MKKKNSVQKTDSPMREFPLDWACTFFEPGPVLLVVTSTGGKPNVTVFYAVHGT